jgi:sugar O-acyltransferase (sialic acid O-acetyltransferase NeuD family)
MQKIQLYGAGKIAQTVAFYSEIWNCYLISSFLVDPGFEAPTGEKNTTVISYDSRDKDQEVFVAVGYQDLNALRSKIHRKVLNGNCNNPSIINPSIKSHLTYGSNCFVVPGLESIEPFVKLGNNVFVWNNVSISHYVEIQDNCWLSNGATVGGSSIIGENTFVGLGAIINHNVRIGKNCIIGSGAIITKDLPNGSVVLSDPAKLAPISSDTAKAFLS